MIVAFVSSWTPAMIALIDSVERIDRSASLRTSAATTAKPLPDSPARAASIAALSASRLVCRAISSIIEILLAISFIAVTASATDFPLPCASFADVLAILSVC